ncbi:MAG: ATP-binding protein [Bacteroidota bacterium]|nr:ATP-binding protein [Bacteroidota bacterium]
MNLLDISIEARVIIGISAMVLLFSSFIIAFISNQRKKLQYHKDLQAINEQQQQELKLQNIKLEDRVQARTLELSQQKESLQHALKELKASQLQLVQKEKMASLGEVASGIAHEIQNPLNFVNNFSEVNAELVLEVKDLLENEKLSPAGEVEINSIIENVVQNLHKINQHGRRADNIVKNMLQHAKSGGGEKELSDINFLADEYLKLSYHAFRAKDNSFNVLIKSSFDPAIKKINIVPQDIGRVLINIYNNAFYSVSEKLKKYKTGYDPIVEVITKVDGLKVLIKIRDNGLGISSKYLDKIYQPFFTTKPTGEGTGLGLSLSYDIIKAHEGELKVDSIEGEYAEFSVELTYD